MLSFVKIYKKVNKVPFHQIGFFVSKYSFSTATEKSKLNYYQVLGISEKATTAEIKNAFHQKAKEHHPDVQANNSSKVKEAEEKFKVAVEAYKVLSDESKRREYDESIKPKGNQSYQNNGTSYNQSTYNSSAGSRTRYSYEKFYGDENIRESMRHTYQQQAYWNQDDSSYQNQQSTPPPNHSHDKKKPSYLQSMNYESLFIWGLGIVLMLRWALLTWETENNYMRSTYSEVEKLNPLEAEEEGVYVDVKLPKDHSKPLTLKDIKGFSIEQLEEIDRMGYILPATAKEKVMDYRETYKLYKRQKASDYWNYNKMYEANSNNDKKNIDLGNQLDLVEEESKPAPKVPKKKKKTLKEAADEVKKEIMQNSDETNKLFNENIQRPESETPINPVGANEVRIPRMKANLYNLEKNR